MNKGLNFCGADIIVRFIDCGNSHARADLSEMEPK